jgi:hypothetical protein
MYRKNGGTARVVARYLFEVMVRLLFAACTSNL